MKQQLRFVGEGGLVDSGRAALAAPVVATASLALAGTAALGRDSTRLERFFARVAERLASLELDIEGLEAVEKGQSYIVVALHEGMADALALLRLPLSLRFAVRDEIFVWPYLGRYLRTAGHPRVDTSPTVASARRFLREAGAVFAANRSLVVFAQGSILGIEVAFRPGVVHLARRFRRPVLPVVLTGSHRVWEHPYSPILRSRQRISMRVLEPVVGLDSDSLRSLERRMKRVALGPGMAPARRFRPESDGWWDGYRYEIDRDFTDLHSRVAAHRASGRG